MVTDGIVLRRAEYKDNDRMLTIFSPTFGRIDAIARGCRKPKSALMNASEPFCAGEFTIREASGRYSVSQCEIKDNFHPLRYDLTRLTHGAYYLSLADAAALPEQEAPDVFILLMKALAILTYSELDPALVTMAFEMRYMPLMGYLPLMDRCALCGGPVEGASRFDAERGGTVCALCPSDAPRMTGGAHRIILRAAQTDMSVIDKLDGHPDWPLAARLYRPFVLQRIDRRNEKLLPELPG